ncbi:MAG: hypothetical protein LC641_00430 [Spirochaeta sp.]|nr:hypothetical protein [Spirochaeta sp.]
MAGNRYTGTSQRRALLVGVWLLLAVLAPAVGEERVQPIIPDEPVTVGDAFLLELEFAYPGGGEQPEFVAPTLPGPITGDGEPTIEVSSRLAGAFGDGRQVRVRVPLRAVDAGRAIIDEFRLEFGGVTVRTRPVLIEVRPRGGGAIPFDLVWYTDFDSLYVGQTIPVSLEMRNLREASFPDDLQVNEPSNAEFVSVPGLGGIQRKEIGDVILLTVPAAAYLLTPTSPGEVTLPQAQLRAGGVTRTAAPRSFEVRELPEEVRGTRAYGSFDYTFELDPQELVEGRSATLFIRIHGEGNFDQLQLPAFQSQEFIVASEGTRRRIEPSKGGYQGSIEARYRITPRRAGTIELRVPPFVWFDAVEQRVARRAPAPIRLEVESRSDAGSGQEEEAQRVPLSATEIGRMKPANWYRRPLSYLSLIPAMLILVLGVFVRRRRAAVGSAALLLGIVALPGLLGVSAPPVATDERVARAVEVHTQEDYQEALNLYGELLEEQQDSPGLWHNAGLAYFGAARNAEAVYALRRSVMLDPGLAALRSELNSVESTLELDRQLELPFVYHPDLFFLLLVVTLSAAAVLGGLSRLRGGSIIVIVLLCFSAVLSTGAMLYSARVLEYPVTVVGSEGVSMKRIPDPDAGAWMHLRAGAAVEASVRHGEFVLIRTGDRVEGWVEAESLIGNAGFVVRGNGR